MNGFLIASAVAFILTVVSFITGGYYVDKYVQLLSLTKQQNAFTRSSMRIGLYLFFFPALFSFLGMKFLQIHSTIVGNLSETTGILHEIQTQTGGMSLFIVTYGILLVGYGQLLIRLQLRRKLLPHLSGMVVFSLLLIFVSQSVVVSLLVSCVLALGVLMYTYRKSMYNTSKPVESYSRIIKY